MIRIALISNCSALLVASRELSRSASSSEESSVIVRAPLKWGQESESWGPSHLEQVCCWLSPSSAINHSFSLTTLTGCCDDPNVWFAEDPRGGWGDRTRADSTHGRERQKKAREEQSVFNKSYIMQISKYNKIVVDKKKIKNSTDVLITHLFSSCVIWK